VDGDGKMEGVGEQRKKEGKEVGIWYKGKHNQPTPSILQLTLDTSTT